MADEVTRSASRIGALVAVPVGLLAFIGVLVFLSGVLSGSAQPQPSPTATAPAPIPSAPVVLAERDLTEREEIVCRALLSQLPMEISELPQRSVSAGSEQNAAYGEPPITVQCGVPAVELDPTEQVWPREGVCYQATEKDDATVWTTLDREVPVQVTVPDAYDGPGQWVTEFSATIVDTVLSADEIPSGCR